MLAARRGTATAWRNVRTPSYIRTAPRAFSAAPPDVVENAEKYEKAIETIRRVKETMVSPRTPGSNPVADDEEIKNPVEASCLDPLPADQVGRKVVISKQSRSTMTSFTSGTDIWRLKFKKQERWTNPLMGWTSSADPFSNMELLFETSEQAVLYCKKRGLDYEVKKPPKVTPASGEFAYGDNFLPRAIQRDLKIKAAECVHFAFPTTGASHYERPLSFRGDRVVKQHGNPEK